MGTCDEAKALLTEICKWEYQLAKVKEYAERNNHIGIIFDCGMKTEWKVGFSLDKNKKPVFDTMIRACQDNLAEAEEALRKFNPSINE